MIKDAHTFTKKEQLLIASGLVPLLFACKTQPDFLPLFYCLFVIAYFFSKKHTSQEKPDNKTLSIAAAHFCLNLTLLGLLAEALAIFNHNLIHAALGQNPDLFQSQLLAITSGGAGFYLGWALALCLVGKQFGFSLTLAIFSGLYPPALTLLPKTISLNCWQPLNLLHQAPDSYSTFYNSAIFMTLAGLAYLSSFGRLTTEGANLPSLLKPGRKKLRAFILLTLGMCLAPWSMAWLFLQAAKLFQYNF
jgi:hypothetical protein